MEEGMDEEIPRRSWFRFLLKAALILAIFLAVVFTTLSMLGGRGAMLQAGAEQFFSRAFGHPAHIETFNGLHFFPDFRLDIEGLRIAREGEEETLLELRSLRMAMGFWDMAFRTGRVKAFDLAGLEAAPGVLHPGRITVERLTIMTAAEEGGTPFLEGNGRLGEHPWTLRMGLIDDGAPGRPAYSFGERRDFTFTAADLKVEGMLVNDIRDLAADDFRLSEGGRDMLTGRPLLQLAGTEEALLAGDVSLQAEGRAYALKPALRILHAQDGLHVSGRLGVAGGEDDLARVTAALEETRLKIQSVSGYPPEVDGVPMLLGMKLHLEVTVEKEDAAP